MKCLNGLIQLNNLDDTIVIRDPKIDDAKIGWLITALVDAHDYKLGRTINDKEQ